MFKKGVEVNLFILTAIGIGILVIAGLYVRLSLRRQHLAEAVLAEKLLQQELIAALSQSFISSENTGVLIQNALMMLGMSMKVSRTSLAALDSQTNIIAFAYEWRNPSQDLRPLPQEGAPFVKGEIFYDTFVDQGDMYLACNNIDENTRLAATLGPLGVKSCVFVPITVWGQLWGILGIEQCIAGQVWKERDIQILKLVSGAITSLLIRAEAEQALVKAKEEAELSNKAKSSFLSRMSHEMRTPMNAIIGMTTIALNSRDREKMEYCLGKINEASLHLLGVINDILDMSKIEAGQLELSCSEFDFERMLNRVTDMVEFKINEKHQNFIVRLDPGLPAWVIADEQRLAQVLTNLLSNAVKFTPEGGTIILSARQTGGRDMTHNIRFDVIDSGIGISAEQKERLFTAFEQADGTISRRFGGTGLGLAISKSIVELMDGRIWIESEPGTGSDFAIELALREGEAAAAARGRKIARENLRVLAVDDSEEVLEYFREYARQAGLQCTTAADGVEACRLLDAAAAPPFDIVFVDWRMPNMNGIELSEKIKSRYGGEVVVIMISASEWELIEKDAKNAGVDGFIPKPLFPSVLTETINRFIEEPSDPGVEPAAEKPLVNLFAGYTIMLVEDVEINREIVISLLEDTGIGIVSAENGAVAVKLYAENPGTYRLILMDIHMPEMNGYEAAAAIRAFEAEQGLAAIPVVAMTANVFKEDVEKALESGMNDHLGKPIEFDQLVQRLRKYLLESPDRSEK
jgi:signal transduction histidine kinase/CheY-like chemotaxis protein